MRSAKRIAARCNSSSRRRGSSSCPRTRPAPRGAADYQTYEITIDDGGRKHTVVFSDPVTPAVRKLVDRLRALTRAEAALP